MQKKIIITFAAVAALVFTPSLPFYGLGDSGAAYANNGNGNGGGNGNGNGGGNGNGNAGGNGNSANSGGKAANGAKASSLGKMNGALNASINAVLAHIKNGQTANGPVGLLAGLAVADADAAAAAADLAGLQEATAAYDALDAAVAGAGYETVADYLADKVAGTATEEAMAAIDPLIDAVGGTTEDGLALAETAPTEEEIAAAEDAVTETLAAIAEVEAAIGDAMNKDGDLEALLDELRARLVGYEDAIASAME